MKNNALMSRWLFVFLLSGLASCQWLSPKHDDAAVVERPSQKPAAVVLDFYAMHKQFASHGLPDDGAINAYRAFLSHDLLALIENARRQQQLFIARHPDEKPPLVDGDLFSSLEEGAQSVSIESIDVDDDEAKINVAMRYGEGDALVSWIDQVRLLREDGVWCIDDVRYRGDWDAAHHGRLSKVLKAAF